jgi:hypothetical protein
MFGPAFGQEHEVQLHADHSPSTPRQVQRLRSTEVTTPSTTALSPSMTS